MRRFSKSNRFVWVVLIVNAPLQLRNGVSVMINRRSCSTRTAALGARNNTSSQVLHSQTVEAFMTSICCCIDFIIRSLERLHGLSSKRVFSAQQVHRVRGVSWLRPIFYQRNSSSIPPSPPPTHQCVHTAEKRETFSLTFFICTNFALPAKAASSPLMLYDSC